MSVTLLTGSDDKHKFIILLLDTDEIEFLPGWFCGEIFVIWNFQATNIATLIIFAYT